MPTRAVFAICIRQQRRELHEHGVRGRYALRQRAQVAERQVGAQRADVSLGDARVGSARASAAVTHRARTRVVAVRKRNLGRDAQARVV